MQFQHAVFVALIISTQVQSYVLKGNSKIPVSNLAVSPTADVTDVLDASDVPEATASSDASDVSDATASPVVTASPAVTEDTDLVADKKRKGNGHKGGKTKTHKTHTSKTHTKTSVSASATETKTSATSTSTSTSATGTATKPASTLSASDIFKKVGSTIEIGAAGVGILDFALPFLGVSSGSEAADSGSSASASTTIQTTLSPCVVAGLSDLDAKLIASASSKCAANGGQVATDANEQLAAISTSIVESYAAAATDAASATDSA